MPCRMNPQQYASVLALSSADRSTHFVGKVADWQQLWGAKNDRGWLVPCTPDGLAYFPVWPHPEYARKIIAAHFPDHHAVEFTLDEFLDHWLATFERDGVKVAVFPDEDWVFWVMEPKDLEQCLRDELTLYE